MREEVLVFYIDAYMTENGAINPIWLDIFKEDASKYDEHQMFELFRKFMTYLDDLGDDEIVIITRDFL